jgi:hypothetical protein
MRPVGDGQRRVCYPAPSLTRISSAGRPARPRARSLQQSRAGTRAPGPTPLPFVRAKMVMSLAWSGFQSTIRDLMPGF